MCDNCKCNTEKHPVANSIRDFAKFLAGLAFLILVMIIIAFGTKTLLAKFSLNFSIPQCIGLWFAFTFFITVVTAIPLYIKETITKNAVKRASIFIFKALQDNVAQDENTEEYEDNER
jgi:hypothetical protein